MKPFPAFVFALACPLASLAQGLGSEGVYSSPVVGLQVIVLDHDAQTVAAEAFVGMGDCSGRISGLGKVRGHVLTFSSSERSGPGNQCRITASFDATWNSVRIKEGSGCSTFHGDDCAWEGQSAKRIKF